MNEYNYVDDDRIQPGRYGYIFTLVMQFYKYNFSDLSAKCTAIFLYLFKIEIIGAALQQALIISQIFGAALQQLHHR